MAVPRPSGGHPDHEWRDLDVCVSQLDQALGVALVPCLIRKLDELDVHGSIQRRVVAIRVLYVAHRRWKCMPRKVTCGSPLISPWQTTQRGPDTFS
jgi:hypothetical protein